MTDVTARYFDGESARQTDVVVQIGPQNIVVRDEQDAVLAVWPPDEVRLVGKPVEGRPLRVGRAKSIAQVVIADPSCLADLERLCPNLNKLRPGIREVWRPITFWSTVAIASAVFLFLVAIPFAAREAALAIPPDIEAQLGEAAADQITRFFSHTEEAVYCSSPQGDIALRELTQRFVTQVDLPYPLTVRVIKSPLVNAFTLPGGQILIFNGLLDFVEGPEEVAGVLAHEIGHALRRHPMEIFAKNVGAATLIGLLLVDITGGSVIGALVQFTVTASYTRDAERDADADAVDLLNGSGIDGSGLVEFFDRL
ncbi:MAG: M48 family metallopeptidase, partial [Alphaproteobacteria bacterium]|nr:M48 family metallopeptidase [Alphaproteobacteria bacterium]